MNLLTGLLGGGADIFNSYVNWKNYKLQENQYGYQRDLQQQIFNREDNATQRRVADLRAAGLSPVLAAGSAASTGPIVQTHAPQMEQMPNIALDVMALLKMENDISTTKAQRDLIESQKNLTDISAAIKDWDYSKFVEWNLPSNASGLAKTIRDLGSMIKGVSGNIITPTVEKLDEKLKPAGDKKPYKSPYDQRSDYQRLKEDFRKIFKQ